MKNKKILKKLLSLLCATTIIFGGMSGFAIESKATSVEETLEANGYTKLGADAFGITQEVVYNWSGVWATHTPDGVTTLDKKYLDVELSWANGQGVGNGDLIHYMGVGNFYIYVAWTAFYIYDAQNGAVLYNDLLSNYEAKEGEYFNLKVATDIKTNEADTSKSDVTFQVWINDISVTATQATATVATANLGTTMTVSSGTDAQTIKIKPHVDEVVEPDVPVIPDMPEGLEGYTRISAESLGITEEVVLSGSGVWKPYTPEGVTSFDKKFLDADISWTGGQGVGAGDVIRYMGADTFYIYVAWTAFYIYDAQNGVVLYNDLLSNYEAKEGEYFNLKVATDIKTNETDTSKSDVTFQVWINDNPVSAMQATATVTTANLVTNMIVSSGTDAQTIKIKPHVYEVVEPEVPVVIGDPVYPKVPEALADYTRLTPESFGITEEKVHQYVDTPIDQNYYIQNSTDFNKTYFDADLLFTDTQGTNIYGGFGYLNPYMFRLYISGTTLVLYSIEGGYEVMYQAELRSHDIAAGDYFNLKLATDFTDSATEGKKDVKVQMWVNNTLVTPKKDTVSVPNDYAAGSWLNVTLGEVATIKITNPAEEMLVHYSDISAYRNEAGYTAPETPAGYIFAGWYTDEACTFENAVADDVMDGAAYAKFIDARVLTVKAQITAGTTSSSSSTNMRFVTSANDLNYKKIGLKIIIHKSTGDDVRDRVDNVVYKTLTAMVGDESWNYTPQGLFSSKSTCFKAWVIKDITSANFNTEFEVTPYWETLDGTVVTGKTETKTVSQGFAK